MSKKPAVNGAGQGINIEQLLAAPFVAAANANYAMAAKQTQFMIESCFNVIEDEEDETNEKYLPKMITLSLTKSMLLPRDNDAQKPKMEAVTTTFQVPLLTLIPFNSLSIQDVNVKFDMEIVSQVSGEYNGKNPHKKQQNTQLKGAVSHDANEGGSNQYKRRNSAKLSVEMKAGTVPLSEGFKTILELYNKNITPNSVDSEKTKSRD